MSKTEAIRDRLGEVVQVIAPFYRDELQAKSEEFGLNEDPMGFFLLAVSHDFLPENTSAAKFHERTPYANPQNFEDGLKALADKGRLEPVGNGEYRMTDEAKQVFKTLENIMISSVADQLPLGAETRRAPDLMLRVIEAALAAPEPTHKPHLTVNRNSDHGPDAPPLMRIMQYAADLGSFRDDVHVAAWQAHNVSGPAWEAFTYLWREGPLTFDALIEKLPEGRKISPDDYRTALTDLVQRGWLTQDGDTYTVTDAGKTVREGVEATTDRQYDAAWAVLSDDEFKELDTMLVRLRDALKVEEPASA